MTAQEQQLIAEFAQKLRQSPLDHKDVEAEQFIRRSVGDDPDALYKLTQTVLVQNIALEQARAQIVQLQQHSSGTNQAQQSGGSFLGNLFGRANAPHSPAQTQVQSTYPNTPGYGGGGFLRSAATTAAGVAAGALAFEGVESLLHGFGGHGSGLFGGGSVPSETVINNYYDTPSDQADLSADTGNYGDAGNGDVQDSDLSDVGDDGSGFGDGADFGGDVGGSDDLV